MYSFLVKHPSVGKLIQKDVDMDVLQKEYLDMINKLATKFEDTIDPTQWLFVKKNNKENVFETGCEATVKIHFNKNHMLTFLPQNKLSYIGMVRILLTANDEYNFNYKQHCPIKSVDFKFHVLTCNPNNETNDHKYVFLSEEDLCDICHKDSVKTWKQTALKHFLTCFKMKGMVKYPNNDNNDPEFLTIQSDRNHYGLPVFVYIPIPEGKKFHYDSVQIQLQITAFGYHKKLNKSYGLVLRPDGRKSHEEIDEQWIRDNNWQDWYETEDIIQYIKEITNQSFKPNNRSFDKKNVSCSSQLSVSFQSKKWYDWGIIQFNISNADKERKKYNEQYNVTPA